MSNRSKLAAVIIFAGIIFFFIHEGVQVMDKAEQQAAQHAQQLQSLQD